jgi:ABC-type sugar transport system ATPase subunit
LIGLRDSAPAKAPDVLLEVRSATKRFGAVVALEGVDLSVARGEIVALLGDNGAGKSTLIKAISGVHALDHGDIVLQGRVVNPRTPVDARRLGIETVYQDLALFDNLSTTANFFAGREVAGPRWLGRAGWLRERHMAREVRRHLEQYGIHLPDPRLPVGLLSGGQRQAIAVARAVSFAARVVILDEPTAALGVRESQQVLNVVRRLPEHGLGVIFISHNMEHVTEVAHRAVVLRQGRLVGQMDATPESQEQLVSLIVRGGRHD